MAGCRARARAMPSPTVHRSPSVPSRGSSVAAASFASSLDTDTGMRDARRVVTREAPMRTAILLAGLCLGTAAEAHEVCPWAADALADAAAMPTRVHVRGHEVLVRGAHHRRHFAYALEVCGEQDAKHRFEQWRRQRRTTNWLVAGGLLVPYVWLALPITTSMAGVRKQQMLRQLED